MEMTTSAPFAASRAEVGGPAAVLLQHRDGLGEEIESRHLMAGLDQVPAHRPAHIAESDEGNAHLASSLGPPDQTPGVP